MPLRCRFGQHVVERRMLSFSLNPNMGDVVDYCTSGHHVMLPHRSLQEWLDDLDDGAYMFLGIVVCMIAPVALLYGLTQILLALGIRPIG